MRRSRKDIGKFRTLFWGLWSFQVWCSVVSLWVSDCCWRFSSGCNRLRVWRDWSVWQLSGVWRHCLLSTGFWGLARMNCLWSTRLFWFRTAESLRCSNWCTFTNRFSSVLLSSFWAALLTSIWPFFRCPYSYSSSLWRNKSSEEGQRSIEPNWTYSV